MVNEYILGKFVQHFLREMNIWAVEDDQICKLVKISELELSVWRGVQHPATDLRKIPVTDETYNRFWDLMKIAEVLRTSLAFPRAWLKDGAPEVPFLGYATPLDFLLAASKEDIEKLKNYLVYEQDA